MSTEKVAENSFLPPDIVIKSKLDSIWTELQSNLPSIAFESNYEVLLVFFSPLILSALTLLFLIKDNESDEAKLEASIMDYSKNNNDDDEFNDIDDIKNIYASFNDDQDLIKNGYFENFNKFIVNSNAMNVKTNNDCDDDDDDENNNDDEYDKKNESLINNNEIFIKLDKNNKINFDNFNNTDQLKKAESVAKASKITKAIFDQTNSKLNMEIFDYIDIGKNFQAINLFLFFEYFLLNDRSTSRFSSIRRKWREKTLY